MRHNFKRSLAAGAAGETRLHAMFPSWTRTDGRIEDFIMPNGDKVDLKTESRSSLDTPNIAAELSSSDGRPGAIERAVNDSVKYIIFLFADDVYFMYRAVDLLAYMNTAKHRTVRIPNQGWTSTIMLVPRETIKHLEVQIVTEE